MTNTERTYNLFDELMGFVEYFDESNTHASSVIPVMFEVTQGPTPTPKPSPTKKPAPQPVDACAGQIRN